VSRQGAVIDLDLSPAAPEPPPLDRRRFHRRWFLVALAVAIVGSTLTGAAAPTSVLHPAGRIPVPDTATYQVFDDTVYVAEGSVLTAFPLPSGPPRWSTRLPMQTGHFYVDRLGTVVVATTPEYEQTTGVTIAVDRRTGAVRWERPFPLAAVDPVHNRLLLGQFRPTEDVGSAPSGQVLAVDQDTGALAWGYTREHGCLGDLPWPVLGPQAAMAVLCADGVLQVLDLGSGRVRATATLPEVAAAAGTGYGVRFAAVNDLILLTYVAGGRMVYAALDQTGLRPKWSVDLEPNPYLTAGCGRLLCLFGPTAVVALDPANGLVRWRLEPGAGAYPFGDRYLVVQSNSERVKLIDSGTGRVVVDLAGWIMDHYQLDRPVFYRSDPARHRIWLAVLSTGAGGFRPLGSVPSSTAVVNCGSTDRYLVCRTVKDTLQVWRVDLPR
jgi:outer membrane protein assembly factor BamB